MQSIKHLTSTMNTDVSVEGCSALLCLGQLIVVADTCFARSGPVACPLVDKLHYDNTHNMVKGSIFCLCFFLIVIYRPVSAVGSLGHADLSLGLLRPGVCVPS